MSKKEIRSNKNVSSYIQILSHFITGMDVKIKIQWSILKNVEKMSAILFNIFMTERNLLM